MSFQKKKIFCFEKFFSYMAIACMRELARTRDMGLTCRHLSRNVHTFA